MKIKKYLSISKISLSQEVAYRLNFVMWRVRNVLQILVAYFLWTTIFTGRNGQLFGYDQNQIITYIFGVLVVRAIVLSSKSSEIAGEISRGDISNFLLKPINYFKYWLARDFSSKILNLGFAAVEGLLLYVLLKPPFFLQTNPSYLLLFALSIILAVLVFFFLMLLVDMVAFWAPENGWAGQFIFIVIITEFLSGSIFPLDILPFTLQRIIYLLPFPYLIFFPVQVYLGKFALSNVLGGLMIEAFWVIALSLIVNFVWSKGIKKYEGVGR